MRVLLYLGTRPDQLCSVSEIARAYGVSQNHLMKVANDLVRQGHVTSVRGRFGGMRLGRPPGEINLGAVIRHTEEGFGLAACDPCLIAPACGLTGELREGRDALVAVLDGVSRHHHLAPPPFSPLLPPTDLLPAVGVP